ncbi:MAG: PGF-pre-PGF domain-containing protein [Candidatus Aenigmarchaeota archaeon]|nr:PGF-pre-PGF domain-containing protein [Candidatus Aenigmarchaeota archaeon]
MRKGMYGKSITVSSLLIISAIICLTIVLPGYAASFDSSVDPLSLSAATPDQTINFTISNIDPEFNITQVNITLPGSFILVDSTNWTSALDAPYDNTTSMVYWMNNTEIGIVENGTEQYFAVDVNVMPMANTSFDINVSTLDANGTYNSTNVTILVNDTMIPVLMGEINTTVSTFSPSTETVFNMSINDNVGVNSALITVMNSTDVLINNASMSNISVANYSYSVVLPAGSFNWTVYASDTSGNWNSSVTSNFSIAQADNEINVYLNNGTEYANQNIGGVYGTQINVTGICDAGTCMVFRNGTDVTSENLTDVTIGAGVWEYIVNTTLSQNYTDNSSTYYVMITQAPVMLSLANNISWSGTYPDVSMTTGTGCPSQITCGLYREGLDASSENATGTILGAGAHNYTLNTSGNTNYSSNTTANTLVIAQGTPDVQVFIDSDGQNKTVQVPNSVEIRGNSTTTITPPTFTLFAKGTNSSGNPATISGAFEIGVYNVVYNTSGNANWTSASNSSIFLIVTTNATNPVSLTINNSTAYDNQNVSITYGTSVYVNCSNDYTGSGSCFLYRDGVYLGTNETVNLGAGTYAYKVNTTGNVNYSANSSGITYYLIVSQANNPVQLLLNDTLNGNKTYTYPEAVKANATSTIGNVSIYRNDVEVTNGTLTAEENILLGNGTYAYKVNATGNANYSANTTGVTYYALVNKGATLVSLLLNGEAADQTSTYPNSTINATAVSNVSGLYVQLWRNGTLISNATTVAWNSSTWPAWDNNFSAKVLGNDNYTESSLVDFWWNVSQASNPIALYLNGTSNNTTYAYPDVINATAVSAGGEVFLYRNASPISNGTSPQNEIIRLGNGTYVFAVNATGNQNYSANSTNITYYAFVNKGILNLTVNMSPSSSVVTGNRTTVSVLESNVGDSDVNYTLYRDGALLDNVTNESAILSVGSYIYTLNATGGDNWTANSTGINSTLTITAGSAAAFVSTGGSGPLPQVIDVDREKGKANVTIGSMSAGQTTNVSITKTEDVVVRKISITVKNAANDIQIRITKIAGAPASVSHEIEGNVYHYMNIDKENIDNDDINQTVIRFAVNKTWLEQNNINAAEVSMYRWEETLWNELTTTIVSNDSTEYIYEAVSPGFSTFVIGVSGSQAEAPVCIESWSCTDWSECAADVQTRTCTDSNSCGTTSDKPAESQACEMEAIVAPGGDDFPVFEVSLVAVLIVILILFVLLEVTGHIKLSMFKELFGRKKSHKTNLYELSYRLEEPENE